MRRAYPVVLLLLAGVFVCAQPLAAQVHIPNRPRHGSGDSSSGNTGSVYVLVEKRGLEVNCLMYGKMEDIKKRAVVIKRLNREAKEANKAIDDEVKALKALIAAKGRELGECEDDDQKAELEKQIAELKAQIAEKESGRQLLIKVYGPKEFKKREDAEKYMEKVYEAAEKMREKAEAEAENA